MRGSCVESGSVWHNGDRIGDFVFLAAGGLQQPALLVADLIVYDGLAMAANKDNQDCVRRATAACFADC